MIYTNLIFSGFVLQETEILESRKDCICSDYVAHTKI